MTNNLELGKAGELRVASELLVRGHRVSLSLVDSGIDLILDTGIKIQVKTSNLTKRQGKKWPAYVFNFRRWDRTKPPTLNNVDFAILWCVGTNDFFIIPADVIEGKYCVGIPQGGGKNLSIGKTYLKYKNNWNLLK